MHSETENSIVLQPMMKKIVFQNYSDKKVRMSIKCPQTEKEDFVLRLGISEICTCELLIEDYFVYCMMKLYNLTIYDDDICMTKVSEKWREETVIRIEKKKGPKSLKTLCMIFLGTTPDEGLPLSLKNDIIPRQGFLEMEFEASNSFVRNCCYFGSGKNIINLCCDKQDYEYAERNNCLPTYILHKKKIQLYWENPTEDDIKDEPS